MLYTFIQLFRKTALISLSLFLISFSAFAEDTLVISSIEHSIAKDNQALPPIFHLSHRVALPNNAFITPSTSAWYRFSFEQEDVPQKSLSLFLPLVNMNASIYLNKHLIGASGSFDEPMSRFWHTPVLFYLPVANLKQGENIIDIRLKASIPNNLTQLGKMYLGDIEPIYKMYAKEYFTSYTIHLMALSAALFLGFITLYLWFIRRFDEYLYFSLAAITWAISSLNIVIHNPPFSSTLWEWLIHSTLSWMPLFVFLFVRRIIGRSKNNSERFLLILFFVFSIVLFIVPNHYFFPLANVWHFLSLVIGLCTVALVLLSYFKHHERTTLILGLGFLTVALFAAHDFLVVIDVINADHRFLLDYSMPLLLLAIAIVLIHRFVEASQGLEHANATLEQRVQDAENEIKEGYAIISAMETHRAVKKERTRIFDDLHDDLGAKLLSLVYKSETPEQQKLAKQAMNGLREIVKRSPHQTPSIKNTITLWLEESQTRTLEQNISFEWHQHHIPDGFIPPFELTNVLREAISNAIKHGDGRKICVRLQVRFGMFLMSVSNSGKPFFEGAQQGSGRDNMLNRIEKLGGRIRWRSGRNGGCHVAWIIPQAAEA